MNRKQLCVLLIMVVVALSGCGKEKQTVLRFSDDTYQANYVLYEEPDMNWTQDSEKLPAENQSAINELGEDVCAYLNSEFDAEWQFKPLEAYVTNVTDGLTQQNTELKYGACYYDNKIFIDKDFIENGLDVQAKYIIAHELIHYLYHLNGGNKPFALYKANASCGAYLNEAIVDSLARRYMIAKHPEVAEVNDQSNYKMIRMIVDLCQLENSDLFEYFFKYDVKGLQKAVDKHIKKYVVCKGSPFEKMLSLMDEITLVKEVREDRMSAILSLLAVTTSAKNADEFVTRGEEDGYDFNIFTQFMY